MKPYKDKWITVYNEDCLKVMKKLEDNRVDLVVTSPPYNVGKSYEDGMSWEEHIDLVDKSIKEIARILKPGRIVCWNVSNNPQRNLSLEHGKKLEKYLTYLEQFIWEKKNVNASHRFGGYLQGMRKNGQGRYYPNAVWETIYVYLKGDKDSATFLGDFPPTQEIIDKFRNDVWELKPERLNQNHPAPMPLSVASALIRFYSVEGQVVLDPFLGSGTTCVAAKNFGRHSIGIDKNPRYFKEAIKRIKRIKHPNQLKVKYELKYLTNVA